jgi:hypothetical protein
VLGDIQGEGEPAIIVAGTDSTLYGWELSGARVSGFPVCLQDAGLTSPAVGELDGDQSSEIALVTRDGWVAVFDDAGVPLSGWPAGPFSGAGKTAPILADVTGDGVHEVFVAGEDPVLHGLSAGGANLAGWPVALSAIPAGEPAAADLNGDGRAEIVVASADGLIQVLTASGSALPGWPVSLGEEPASGPIVLVVDGSLSPSIVLATRRGCLEAFGADGRRVPGWPLRHSGQVSLYPAGGGFDSQDGGAVWLVDDEAVVRRFAVPSSSSADPAPWGMLGGNSARTRALKPRTSPGAEKKPLVEPSIVFTPNPFREGVVQARVSMPPGSSCLLEIFDVQGRLVRRAANGPVEAGELVITWDGRDDRGDPVAAGVYSYRVSIDGRPSTGRLVRLD